jgi:hypothetical protein
VLNVQILPGEEGEAMVIEGSATEALGEIIAAAYRVAQEQHIQPGTKIFWVLRATPIPQ